MFEALGTISVTKLWIEANEGLYVKNTEKAAKQMSLIEYFVGAKKQYKVVLILTKFALDMV